MLIEQVIQMHGISLVLNLLLEGLNCVFLVKRLKLTEMSNVVMWWNLQFSLNNIKRPILKIDWLYQCWQEHRLVPHEPYRLPPFTGLTICATNVPLGNPSVILRSALFCK